MKWLLVIFFLFQVSISYTQDFDYQKLPIDSNLRVYVKGHERSDTIDVKKLRQGFRLVVSDSTFRIVRATFGWSDSRWNIHEMVINSDSVNFTGRSPGMGDFYVAYPPDSNFQYNAYADNIVVSKNGQLYKTRYLIIYLKDEHRDTSRFKKMKVCHDAKKRPVCYSDGKYRIDFEKKRLKGWSIDDSLIVYNEEENKISLADKYLGKDSSLTLILKDTSLVFQYGKKEISFYDLPSKQFSLGRFWLFIRKSDYRDTIELDIGDNVLEIVINKGYRKLSWRWDILIWHRNIAFDVQQFWKKQRTQHIFLFDTASGQEVAVWMNREGKRISSLSGNYKEEIPGHPHRFKRLVTGAPYFYYRYNRFGKIRNKQSTGESKVCLCN
jgi:hypothetical protein